MIAKSAKGLIGWRCGAAGLLLGLYLLSIFLIKVLDVPNQGLNILGLALLAYHAARIVVALSLLLCFLTFGVGVLRVLVPAATARTMGWRPYLVCSGFVGSTTLALIMLLLGAFHWYYLVTALVLTLPVLGSSPWMLSDLASLGTAGVWSRLTRGRWLSRTLFAAIVVALPIAASLTLAIKGLFPECAEGDVWEHYLHYYWAVMNNHGLAPNDVWYHFYLSKGAGLYFLSLLLTDSLGAALVSWCLVVFATVLVYDLVLRTTKDFIWAGIATFMLLLYIALPLWWVTSFHKHHISYSCLVMAVIWSILRRVNCSTAATRRVYLITACLVGFYVGIYVPPGGVVLVAALCGMAIISAGTGSREARGVVLPAAAFATLIGAVSTLAFNYAVTGMAEAAPFRTWWDLADKERFSDIWSRECVEFFFAEAEPSGAAKLSASSFCQFDGEYTKKLCRLDYFEKFFRWSPLVLLAAGMLSSWVWTRGSRSSMASSLQRVSDRLRLILLMAGAICGAVYLAQVIPNTSSLIRMYVFVGFLIIPMIVLLWSALLHRLRPTCSVALTMLALVLPYPALKMLSQSTDRLHWRYIQGRVSTRQALTLSERIMVTVTPAEARKHIGPDGRILSLDYEPNPFSFLPYPPIAGEVSYAFGRKYPVILYGSPEEAIAAFKELGITHFGVNLQCNLFCGIPYSRLFESRSLDRYFSLVWNSGDYYLLTWKHRDGEPLPPRFLHVMELKQENALSYVTLGHFHDALQKLVDDTAMMKHELANDRSDLADLNPLAAYGILLLEMNLASRLQQPQSRQFLSRFLARVREKFRSEPDGSEIDLPTRVKMLADHTKAALKSEAEATYGHDLAEILVRPTIGLDTFSPITNYYGDLYERGLRRYESTRQQGAVFRNIMPGMVQTD